MVASMRSLLRAAQAQASPARRPCLRALCASAGSAPPAAPILSSGARIRSPDAEYVICVALGMSTFTATVVDGMDETVVVKATSLRSGGWRALDTWEATRGVLKALSHPSLPPLLDAFQQDVDGDVHYVLVRRLAPGRPLTSLVLEERWRPDEAAVTTVCDALLSALAHCGDLRPPVALGGISPARVLLQRDSSTVSLVGFGDALSEQAAALGYAPPEAQRGVATPAGDLYAVGATALFLLSGVHPGALPLRGATPDWSAVTVTSPQLRALLGAMLQAEPAARGDAARALALLRGVRTPSLKQERPINGERPVNGERPRGGRELLPGLTLAPSAPHVLTWRTFDGSSKISGPISPLDRSIMAVEKRDQWGELITSKIQLDRLFAKYIQFVIPPLALSSDEAIRSALGRGAFTAAWLALVGNWTAAAVVARAPLVTAAFSTPFWAAGGKMVADLGGSLGITTTVRITPQQWSITATLLGRAEPVREIGGPTSLLAGARERRRPDAPMSEGSAIELLCRKEDGAPGYDKHELVDAGLRPVEVRWICRELNQYLADVGAVCGYEPILLSVGGDESSG